MNVTKCATVALTTGMVLATGTAIAASKGCNLAGTYTDSLGSTIVFKNNKHGTANNPAICPSMYKLTVTTNTQTALDVKGTAKGCGALTAVLVPNYPTCTSASGTVTIQGLGSFPDTITKQGDLKAPPSVLENGLK